MRYLTHHDFMPSVYAMYKKNGKNRKISEKVLSMWAKSQNHNLFGSKEIFTSRQTANGENRIRHCRKYNLSDGCRLITVFNQDTYVFVFLGSHDECDDWIEKNRHINFDKILIDTDNNNFAQNELPSSTLKLNSTILNAPKYIINDFKRNREEIELYAEILKYDSGVSSDTTQGGWKYAKSSFLEKDCIEVKNIINIIAHQINRGRSKDALILANNLEDFLTFMSAKLYYINKLGILNNNTFH